MEEYREEKSFKEENTVPDLQYILYAADAFNLLFGSPLVATRILLESMIKMSVYEDKS